MAEARRRWPKLRFVTDAHSPSEVVLCVNRILDPNRDMIQIPAFLSRQTDLLTMAGQCFRHVNVKRMQCMSGRSAAHIAEKVRSGGRAEFVALTDRGTALGYETLLIDPGMIPEVQPHFDAVLLDATHSTQRFSVNQTTEGSAQLGARFFQATRVLGYDGAFLEAIRDPSLAISDASMQLPLSWIADLISAEERIAACIAPTTSG